MLQKSMKVVLGIIAVGLILFFILLVSGARFFTDYLWFANLDYVHTYLVMFFANFGVRLTLFVIFTIFIFINLYFTKNVFLQPREIVENENVESIFGEKEYNFRDWINKKRLLLLYLGSSGLLAFLFSSVGQEAWKTVLKFFNQTSFGVSDPIFARDISFYFFSLPFFNFIKEIAMLLILLTLVVVTAIYLLNAGVNPIVPSLKKLKSNLTAGAKKHMTILLTAFIFLKAWDYRLEMYELLFSPQGAVFGAGFTDINANLLGLWIRLIIVLIIGVWVLFNLVIKQYKLILVGVGAWFIVSIIFGGIVPGAVQSYRVDPNELEFEREYIEHNIDMTRKAYGLDDISRREFDIDYDLTARDLNNNLDLINNVRLWDYRPKLSTYGQLQELRPYYRFVDVDVDRYHINGNYQQVMLSARELDKNRLPSRTWVNEKLIYTHGYGLAMSPVNKVTPGGQPEFIIRDLPARTETDIQLDNMALYYGEMTDDYVISNTKAREFHYSRGDQNVYYNYTGQGGVPINSLLRKAVYALRFGDTEILLTDAITTESRVMYYRSIHERVRKIAPFLLFDSDPYLVTAQGRLFWIQDAYTTSDRFPYSTPAAGGHNYFRNSVKIVIDAYNGDVDFYIVDEDDPLIMTYNNIFPNLFTPGEEIPEALQPHIRYPEDLFSLQTQLYRTYHMQDPDVFYNQEDLWDIPTEKYGQRNQDMEPYYILNRLLGNENLEFLLMLPFTPSTRNNMISWMAARSDPENYGELVVYNFPEGELVYGPQQIESRIDQTPEISQQLSLWGQRGSRVIRGNLLVIPIENSVLYIEPVYIEAEDTQIPELRRVIVAYEESIIMAPNLDAALTQIFGNFTEQVVPDEIVDDELQPVPDEYLTGDPIISERTVRLSREALEVYQEMLDEQRQGNWARYGELLNELEEILIKLEELGEQVPDINEGQEREGTIEDDIIEGDIIDDELNIDSEQENNFNDIN